MSGTTLNQMHLSEFINWSERGRVVADYNYADSTKLLALALYFNVTILFSLYLKSKG